MDNLPQNNQKPFLSSLTAKIILALIIFAGSTIIIISGVKFIIENYKIPINKIIKSQCEIDSDCKLVYTGSDICLPCDTSINEYECFPSKRAEQIQEERFKRLVESKTLCERCLEKSQHSCECENGKCKKVKEQLVEEDYIIDKKISKEQAISLLKKQCGYYYDYDNMIEVGNEWRVIIINVNCPCCYGIVNAESGAVDCFTKIPCSSCAKEGEFINYPAGTNKNLPNFCCDGLKALAEFGINKNNECKPLIFISSPFLTCMPCGNRVCEEISYFKENKCNCPEDCGEDKCILTPNMGPCKAIFIKYYFDQEEKKCKEFNWGGCKGVVPFETMENCKKECEKQINTSDLSSKASATEDWQTYQNKEFGFEFKYPKIGEYGDEIKIFEKENVIELCTKGDVGPEYDFCHSLEVFRKKSTETMQEALKRLFLEGKDKSCHVEEFSKIDNYRKKFKITSDPEPFWEIDCGKYQSVPAITFFLYDNRYPNIFFYVGIGHDSFFNCPKWWIESIKINSL